MTLMTNEPFIALCAQNFADCKHLEVTLQAVRCEHTAADAAIQSALQTGDELVREATTRLFLATRMR